MNAIRFSAVVFGSLLFACTPPRDVVQATSTPASGTPVRVTASPGFLVWTHGENGTFHTVLLDDASKKLGEVDTALVAVDGRISALARTHGTRQLTSCDAYGTGADMGPSTEESLSLVRLDDDESRTIMASYFGHPATESNQTDGEEVGTVNQSASLAGSVGPYLFLEESTWQYACGAHGGWGQSSHVVDARSGKEVKLVADDLEKAEAAARAAFVKLGKEGDGIDSLWQDGDPGEIQHVAMEPRLADGRLGLVHIYLAGVPYAFGTSQWASYAVDTEVPAMTPRELREHLALPPAVSTYIAKLDPKKEPFGGFTEVDDVFAAIRALAKARPIEPRPTK